jgi:hypothetical protein
MPAIIIGPGMKRVHLKGTEEQTKAFAAALNVENATYNAQFEMVVFEGDTNIVCNVQTPLEALIRLAKQHRCKVLAITDHRDRTTEVQG